MVVPADVTPLPDVTVPPPALRGSPALIPPRRSGVHPPRSDAVGGGLAAAVRCINEGAELLAEARQNGNRRASPT